MSSLLPKRIIAFFFTLLVVVPMFFFLPFTPGGGMNEAHANAFTDAITGIGQAVIDVATCVTSAVDCLVHLFFITIPKFFFGLAGVVFDTLLAFSLSSTIIQNQTFVNKGWVIMRDLSNTFFIFILLYIAISTILQTAGGQTKRLLATLVMVALFMNFSLYITKFVIDVGNVFALEFYTNMGEENSLAYIKLGTNDITPRSISKGFVDAFDIEKLLKNVEVGNLNFGEEFFLSLMYGIMYLVATFVFLSVAFLFLARVVSFWFLMILSPLAFFSMILPYTRSKIWGRWSSELISQSFLAPIFLFFLYLTMMLAGTIGNLFTPGGLAFPNGVSFFQPLLMTFLTFFALITTLLFGLKTAKSMSGTMGESMLKIGGTVTGAAVGGAAAAGRNTFGRVARYADDKFGSDLEKSRTGRFFKSGLTTVSNSSFDARASKVGQMAQTTVGGINLGQAGGAGGNAQAVAEKQKDLTDHTKKLLARDPAAAASYLATHEKVGDRDTIATMASLSSAQRAELIAKAKPGKEQDRLKRINMTLGAGLSEKQKKTENLEMARYKNTEAKETIEEFEGIKDESTRKKFIADFATKNKDDKEKRLALFKNMSAAQRDEVEKATETETDKIFSNIDRNTDLTKEELSKVLEQDKKYKDTNRENLAKVAQEGRVTKLKTIVEDYTAGRRTDLAAMQEEAKAHISDMNENEVSALENTYLVSSVVAPHITKGIVAKVEKGDKVKLTVGQKEEFYKNLNDHGSPETKEYLKNQNSAEPKSAARRRFQGGKDNGDEK